MKDKKVEVKVRPRSRYSERLRVKTEIAETNAKVRKEQSEAEIKKAKIDSKLTTVDAALSRIVPFLSP